jgi:hypothetical protein
MPRRGIFRVWSGPTDSDGMCSTIERSPAHCDLLLFDFYFSWYSSINGIVAHLSRRCIRRGHGYGTTALPASNTRCGKKDPVGPECSTCEICTTVPLTENRRDQNPPMRIACKQVWSHNVEDVECGVDRRPDSRSTVFLDFLTEYLDNALTVLNEVARSLQFNDSYLCWCQSVQVVQI